MKKNNLILLIKNQISDKTKKNKNTLHLNTLLLSSIEHPSMDNDSSIELFSYYSNISQEKK